MERYLRAVVVLVLCFLFIASTRFRSCDGYSPKVLCRGEEREALLNFKGGFYDFSDLYDALPPLPSWTGEDCCAWEGVVCHNITGHVLKLELGGSSLLGHINNSLLELKHLQHLDLSENYFAGIIPEFIGSLANLRYLNLSNADFYGPIPQQLGNLSRLHYLDISSRRRSGQCGGPSRSNSSIKDIEWISGLTSLKFLDISGVSLSEASNWSQLLNKLHSLSVLHLHSCELYTIGSLPHVNFSSLTILDLSCNNLISSKFDWFSDLSSLVMLDLSHNKFHGPIPGGLVNMTSLRFLDLSVNNFQGKLPSGIENLTSLTRLDLSHNALEGEILPSLGSLCNFQLLNSSYNKHGRSLEFLYLGWNKFSGHLPDQLGQCKSLFHLSIPGNSFYGPLPMSIGGLSSLGNLDISGNSLEGVVTEKHFANLTKLHDLRAYSNRLTLQVGSNWIPPFQLMSVNLKSWHLGPQFPAWLQTQKNLEYVNISNTGISDFIPDWFGNMCAVIDTFPSSKCIIDLSHNQLKGSIPSLLFGEYIYLGSNSLTGPPPQLSSSAIEVDLSNNLLKGSLSPLICRRIDGENSLQMLDLSGNLLSGELPDCWENWPRLALLNLGDNQFAGPVPTSMGSLLCLSSLHLHNNYLSGMFPPLENCTDLTLMDLSENGFSGSVPMWIGNNLSNLVVLALSSNNFNGSIPLELCYLDSLQILDLGNNGLSGNIPRCFGNFSAMIKQPSLKNTFLFEKWYGGSDEVFTEMETFKPTAWLVVKRIRYEYNYTLGLLTGIDLSSNKLSGEIPEEVTALHSLIFLNLSENHLEGKIPIEIGSMKSLESLDLSMNKLSGVIPQSISTISFLSYLNLSFNNLSGKIPSGTQIQGFSPLSFIGNHELYGPPLTNTRGEEVIAAGPTQDQTDEDDSGWIDMMWFYASMPLGFAVGFWAVLGPLVVNRAWRYAYFKFVEDMIIYKFLGWCL
ncbi:hypothetical protein PVL29_021099 [Vitis rotundifolia]|uniref:Leucine-rich repeat-containing N-terminal plant-type domain-containing protein n=1 Tax=Vitis rotundifolia TaxID=103349 RepID=A0AA38YYI8_VITRO|nr:hypothetical protein PVL29_021099 [Vitis rotundifolia]